MIMRAAERFSQWQKGDFAWGRRREGREICELSYVQTYFRVEKEKLLEGGRENSYTS